MNNLSSREKSEKSTEVNKPANSLMQLLIREGLIILLLALGLYWMLALVTYDPVDSSWTYATTSNQTNNGAGQTGAWIADVSYFLLGYLACFIPLLIFLKAWTLFRSRHQINDQDWLITLSLRVTGLVLTLLCCSSLFALYGPNATDLPAGSGGALGKAVAYFILPAFNSEGATLLLVAGFLIGITALTGLSWFWLMEVVGRNVWGGCEKLLSYSRNRVEQSILVKKQSEPKVLKSLPHKNELLGDDFFIAEPEAKPVVVKPIKTTKPKNPVKLKALGKEMLPDSELLDPVDHNYKQKPSNSILTAMSELLEKKLKEFNVIAKVVSAFPGPVITRFEIQLAAGVKVSKISNLVKDLARSLAVSSVRVVEVIPGKSTVGIEIPNTDRQIIYLTEVISSTVFTQASTPVALALGYDIAGQSVIADLAKMPHLLVAGTTGSGKSVGINAMILSLLFKATPDEVRMIMIDPKMLELSVYDGVPHLLTPVVTDMQEAASALRWCVAEMERRYQLMAALGVRNLANFNNKIKEAKRNGETSFKLNPAEESNEPIPLETLPFIVVIIDEFADMMMVVGKKTEELIARIAQKARAAGIHLILATQRPSVDVITGLIKANIPTRISFQVSSKIDSRTVLDQGGAEQLLGHGDMLYLAPGTSVPVRIHGAFVSDDEVHRVVDSWRQNSTPDYIEDILQQPDPSADTLTKTQGTGDEASDPLYDEAVQFVLQTRKASISSLQRKLKVGYNRAARLIETMEENALVTPMAQNGTREILVPAQNQ